MFKSCSIIRCILALCLSLSVQAQDALQEQKLKQAIHEATSDTTKARLEAELSWLIKFSDPTTAMHLATHTIHIGYKHKQHQLLALGYRSLGILFVMKKQHRDALAYYDSSAFHAHLIGNVNLESQAYSLKGGMYGDLGDYNKSVEYYSRGKDLALLSKNNALIASSCNNLADAFQQAKRSTILVQDNLRLAMHYALLDADSGKSCLIAANLAKEFLSVKQTDSMQYYMTRAARIFSLVNRNPYQVGAVYTEIAGIYAGLHNATQVITYASQAKQIFEDLHRPDNVLIPAAMIMRAYYNLRRFDTAKIIAQQVLALAQQRDAKLYLRDANQTLASIAKQNGNYPEALRYLEEATRWNDSIFSISRDQSIANVEEKAQIAQRAFETQFKTQQKEQQNTLLTTLNATLNCQRWLAIITSILLLVTLVFLAFAYRKRKRLMLELMAEKQVIELQSKEMQTMMGEIHHRVKNNLTMLKSLLFLQARNAKEEETKRILLESQSRIQSMALVHQRLYGDHEVSKLRFPEFIENLLSELALTYRSKGVHINMDVEGSCRELSIELAIPLALMMNELATNSFKYAFEETNEGRLTVRISEGKHEIQIIYADNGKGLPEGIRLDAGGFGFNMLQVLARQINASLTYTYHRGAVFTMVIPV